MYLEDVINFYNCCKTPIFQSKQAVNKKHHISLNSQFIDVLDGIICFTVRFCNNSSVFQVHEDINVIVISALTSTKPCLSFLKCYFLAKTFGKSSFCPRNQPHFLMNSDKSLLSPEQSKLKEEIWDMVCRWKTVED